jgi:hypothetical protein
MGTGALPYRLGSFGTAKTPQNLTHQEIETLHCLLDKMIS